MVLRENNHFIVDMERVGFVLREMKILLVMILGKIKLAYSVDPLEVDPF
jgi:hypothetical protein